MVGFWKRLFGDRKTTGAQAASATEIVADGALTAPSNRVERIDSPRFRPSARPRAEGNVGDTGPWFIGKTVGENRAVHVSPGDLAGYEQTDTRMYPGRSG